MRERERKRKITRKRNREIEISRYRDRYRGRGIERDWQREIDGRISRIEGMIVISNGIGNLRLIEEGEI